MKKVLGAISLLLAGVLGFLLGQSHTQRKSDVGARRVLYYVDPMHPTYKSEKPGKAPDCGMPLEPVYADERGRVAASDEPGQSTPGTVNIDPERQQLAGIRVATVEKTSATRTLRIPGRVTADETRVYRVAAGVDGFVTETHEETVGSPVKKGQRLAVISAREFLPAIGGYLAASERTRGGTGKEGAAEAQSLLEVKTWADRLRNLGMSDAQMQELSAARKASEGVYLVSPADGFIAARNVSPGLRFEKNAEFYRIVDLTHVWVIADLFESEVQYFHPGAPARITFPNLKRSFSARISNILPQIDPSTSTLKLRLEADNGNLALRPGMIVDVELTVATPPGLSVPAGAVLDSGLSQRVFVGLGNGIFEPRQVETGERFGDRVQILKGLAEGEKVVAAGTFLVDSESRLRSTAESARRPATEHASNHGP